MHMADALLSPAVGMAMCAVSVAANAYAVKKIKKDELCEKKIPLMGVMGAFVFAVQMINFTIPATGSSGHIGGGILLAAMIGGFPALLSISVVFIIQCLFFADGGLLALGCNIFNMGVIPCLIVYPLLFKPLVAKGPGVETCRESAPEPGVKLGRITAASVAAVVISLQFGAFCVVLETRLSGITALPFLTFLFLMQPIHLAIGAAEGIVTAAVLCFVCKTRPEIMDSAFERGKIQSGVPVRKTLIALAALAALSGGILSLFASSRPDGLEWSIIKTAGELKTANPVIEALMPYYNFRGEEAPGIGTSAAGIAGGALCFLLAAAAALTISLVKKKRKDG
jgi:cobalt/nickel transport system permease protein